MHRFTITGLFAATVLLLGAPLRAAERVTLSNGFALSCQHHLETQSRVRLYMDSGQDSYIEVTPADIVSIETVPDPPPPSASKASAAPLRSASGSPTHLSPGDLRQMLASAGHAHNLDVDLLASVVKAESGGNAHAVSRTGARGLMQLMPGTASDLGVADSFLPDQNVRGGSAYLDALLTRYHDNLGLALAAYNAGPAAVEKYRGIPPYHETRVYVARVIHEFNRRVRARQAEAHREMAAAATQNGDR